MKYFGTEEILHRIEATGLAELVRHRTLIRPQLGAPGVASHQVAKETGFKVKYGPILARDVPEYLATGNIIFALIADGATKNFLSSVLIWMLQRTMKLFYPISLIFTGKMSEQLKNSEKQKSLFHPINRSNYLSLWN